jgi:hypothetical protein
MMTQYTSGNSVFLEVRELSLYPKSLIKPKTAVMLARMPSQLSPNGFTRAAVKLEKRYRMSELYR